MNQDQKLGPIRHSLAHLMSMAIMEKYSKAGLGVGPAIDSGFYQDYDLPEPISEKDFSWIEKRMREMIAKDIKFVKGESDFKNALEFYKHDPYKTEMINDLKAKGEKTLSFYDSDWFHNLCAGPHVTSTSEIDPESFKIDKIAGAYWRGDEKNKMLQRIYGLAFESKEKLDEFLHNREEAEKRDHRKLGKALDLFSFHEEGPGFAFWHQSGHWDHYQENMYFTQIDERDFAVKPMNCPGGMLVYKSNQHSYKEFPIRAAELGLVHRHELAGTLHGLFRVRSFHQDDAHIFCLDNQIESEISQIIDLIDKMYGLLNLSYHLELSTRPAKSIGSDEIWEKAETALKNTLNNKGIKFQLNPGDGAFYGPKIDFHIADSIGRTWQTATIQLDFAMPERFELEYTAENGSKQRPVMLHRVIFGAVERFLGILIEHYAGAFPLWLSPVQVKILTISEKQKEYASEILLKLKADSIRAELDESDESLGKKIRNAEIEKVPAVWIIGDKEVESKQISERARKDYANKITDGSLEIEKAIEQIKKIISDKT
ncbi:MAG: Threonine-tRNA ligase [Berkelbacteria bacterium GW2011_GWA2_38_9]|uniref:Threonine--tRNA ligase n=1 Tax=Berkelbacteria bacterium GW2011_GWA2_38_9 TaxID=1618334 RepID=A0A0G0LFU3_9BACT|nr:MAG: Threonine-tRNA ligase [Berkelbacteria bacterium GW2011_GWA2_38_9]